MQIHAGDEGFRQGIRGYRRGASGLDPNCVPAIAARGTVWIEKDEPDKALADFNEAVIRLDPKEPALHMCRGGTWLLKEEFDKAIADFDEAIRLDTEGTKLSYVGQ